jgi:transcriptional regulator with XRE-family HTH domain
MHTRRYAFKRQSNLARDTGLSESAISRLVRGHSRPYFETMVKVADALEAELGKRIHPSELASIDGRYPTANVCELVGCPGCLPDEAYNEDGERLPDWECEEPGKWSLRPIGKRAGIV